MIHPRPARGPVITAGIATHVGRVRQHNEDAALADRRVFCVADGMGGHAAGEVASEIAVRGLSELTGGQVTVAQIIEQIHVVNRRILSSSAQHPEQTGMGTTLTGLAAVKVGISDHWAIFNVGDSRVYRYLDGCLSLVTVDHSEVRELVDSGQITAEQARVHPARNVVTRILGRDPMPQVDTWVFPPYAGERFIICSDGLTNELSEDQMAQILRDQSDPQAAAAILVKEAVIAGGRDNVTVVVVAHDGMQPTADVDEDTTPRSYEGGR